MEGVPQRTFAKNRKKIRYKLAKYPNLKKIAVEIHAQYCNMTGNLHTLPDFYVIGVVKGGTTSLFEYLMMHPNTLQPIGKEIDFFGEYYKRGINWYKCCFPLKYQMKKAEKIKGSKCITGEATPRYLDYPHSIKRIKQITPNAKFILLLRNPIDRAYSNYMMNVNSTLESEREKFSFEKAIDIESDRIKGEYEKMIMDENYFSWKYFLYAYLEQGKYINKLLNWTKIFSRERFLILQSEKFFNEPILGYKKILDFLDLPYWIPREFPIFKMGRYNDDFLKPETRNKLKEYFKPYNEKLYDFLEERFDWDE